MVLLAPPPSTLSLICPAGLNVPNSTCPSFSLDQLFTKLCFFICKSPLLCISFGSSPFSLNPKKPTLLQYTVRLGGVKRHIKFFSSWAIFHGSHSTPKHRKQKSSEMIQVNVPNFYHFTEIPKLTENWPKKRFDKSYSVRVGSVI